MESVTWSPFFVPLDLDLHTFFVSKPARRLPLRERQVQKAALLFRKVNDQKTCPKKKD